MSYTVYNTWGLLKSKASYLDCILLIYKLFTQPKHSNWHLIRFTKPTTDNMKPLYEGNKHIYIVPRAKTKSPILHKQAIPSLIPWIVIYKPRSMNGDHKGNELYQMFIS